MSPATPHFLLFSDSSASQRNWRFVLRSGQGERKLEVSDHEPSAAGNRLALLAVVRGLEALDQPSRVTLYSSNPDVARGFRFGLRQWREDGWCWEKFGRMTPIKNGDLWQRVDRALRFHHVEFRSPELRRDDLQHGIRIDRAHRRRHGRRGLEQPKALGVGRPWLRLWRRVAKFFAPGAEHRESAPRTAVRESSPLATN